MASIRVASRHLIGTLLVINCGNSMFSHCLGLRSPYRLARREEEREKKRKRKKKKKRKRKKKKKEKKRKMEKRKRKKKKKLAWHRFYNREAKCSSSTKIQSASHNSLLPQQSVNSNTYNRFNSKHYDNSVNNKFRSSIHWTTNNWEFL